MILTLIAAHCSRRARATTRWRVCTGVSGGGRTRRMRPAAGRPGLTGGAVCHCDGAACPRAGKALTHSTGQQFTRSAYLSARPCVYGAQPTLHFLLSSVLPRRFHRRMDRGRGTLLRHSSIANTATTQRDGSPGGVIRASVGPCLRLPRLDASCGVDDTAAGPR